MDGHGDYHTKGSQREGQIQYCVESKKKKNTQMNLFIEQKRTHRLRECSYGYQRGNVGGRDRLTFESI